MTNPPQSPYGPSDPSQQPAYGQPPMFHPPQVPYGYTVVGPKQPQRSNGPGLAALIIGIVSVVLAFIPLVNIFAFFTGTAGIIVGIIGLVLADRPRKQAAWGTALSAASMVLAFLMFFVYTFGFIFAVGGAIEQSTRDLPTYTATPVPSPTPSPLAPVMDPLPLGTVVELNDADGAGIFEAAVTASVLDADDVVLAIDGNTTAPAGMQWAMATVELTTLAASNLPPDSIEVEYVAADGTVHTVSNAMATPPPADLADIQYTLGIGESGVGNVVIAIPTADATGGLWSLRYGSESSGAVTHYFETA